MIDAQTIAAYDARIDDYLKLTPDRPGRHLRHMIATLGTGAKVLDLGCGPATSSVHLRAAGIIPDPVDASPEMVALANKMHDINARISSFDTLDADQLYDGVWANFSLLHAPKADFPGHLVRIHRALKPNGLFIIGMKLGSDSARDQFGRLYTYYSAAELTMHLETAGFGVTDTHFGESAGLAGIVEPWVIIYCHAAPL
jgi:trans-aconitate methyltransferase